MPPAFKVPYLRQTTFVVLTYWFVLLLTSLRPSEPAYILPLLLALGFPLMLLACYCLWRVSVAVPPDFVYRDDLTGTGSRRAFLLQARNAFKDARAGARALVLVDLEGLQTINDSCGHAAGDEMLMAVAQRLRACNANAYRIDGDEFALIIDRQEGDTVSASLQQLQPFELSFASCGHTHTVGFNFGYASTRQRESFESLFQRAETRLREHRRQLYASGSREDRRGQPRAASAVTDDTAVQAPDVLSLEDHRRQRAAQS
jgi:diguanylate cyclase (GGDEF)-like protein